MRSRNNSEIAVLPPQQSATAINAIIEQLQRDVHLLRVELSAERERGDRQEQLLRRLLSEGLQSTSGRASMEAKNTEVVVTAVAVAANNAPTPSQSTALESEDHVPSTPTELVARHIIDDVLASAVSVMRVGSADSVCEP